ncbi:hypothetical protein ACJMK2_008452 [Sinanodonta woodiana]|uniref:Uncharacterized protein n=1 Tax=Sinanodonta woodiana TaxID=1069815 RepID=A0ABD3VLM9_SINWO
MKADRPARLGRIDFDHGEANLIFGSTEPIGARRCGDIRLGNTLPLSSVTGNPDTNALSSNHYQTE